MKKNRKNYWRRGISLLLAMCMAISLFSLPVQAADSDPQKAYRIDAQSGKISYYADFLAAWNASRNGDTVGLLADKHMSSRLNVGSGSRTVELNGHKLYRQNSTEHSDGAIFDVRANAALTVYGGRQAWTLDGDTVTMPEDSEEKIAGTYFDNSGLAQRSGTASRNLVWHLCYFDYDEREVCYKNNDAAYPVSGGLLCGGWSSDAGGGIHMSGEKANVALYDVTVAGNIADNSGGGIAMSKNYQKLTLVDSRIAYNNAEDDDGGGIYIGGDYCKVYMTRSHVDYNLGYDNGGGIAIDGEGAVIAGDAQCLEPNDPEYPANWEIMTYTANPYANMNGDHNPFWSRTENSSSKHISTAGKTSTLAYNIVTNSDFDGGGGGIYVDDDKVSVSGLNLIKNLALGFGLNATWCGRGAGILLNMEHITLANCNIWKNWSRSEGGGVFVDNDGCELRDVTVTGNYSYTDGWSGGGVYVLGTVNMALSGKCIIKNNSSDEKSKDDLYLGYYNTMYARLYPSLTKGSEVWLWMSGAATDITKVAGEYDERMFYSDDNGYHVAYTDQILKLVKGENSANYIARKYPAIPTTVLVPNNDITNTNSRTRKLADPYISENGRSYPLYQGVAEFPALDDATKDITSTFFYSDGYFDRDPKNYDTHLSTASMHLAISAFYSNDGSKDAVLYNSDGNGTFYPVKSNNIRQFLSDIGVKESDIYLNDSNIQKPGKFTIGVAIGSKDISLGDEQKKLVIIGVRGSNYEQEWVSNMTVGFEGEAKGFASAADTVFSELTHYMKDRGIDGNDENTIFWVAGFSRAGATSNLTGARIVDHFDTEGQRSFIYTFEAPQGGMSTVRENTEKYFCIHNIINNGDLVPQVAPSAMGFHRYGVDHYIPGEPNATAPKSSTGKYYVIGEDAKSAVEHTFKTWRDNSAFKVGAGNYNTQKQKMLQQLKCIDGHDTIFNDYFHTATISYFGNTLFGSYGWQMLDEDSSFMTSIPSDKRNTADFIPYFLGDLQDKSMNFVGYEDVVVNENNEEETVIVIIDKLYRMSFSQVALGDDTPETAIANIAGVLLNMTSEQSDGLMELLSTLEDRFDATDYYFDYLQAQDSLEVCAAAIATGAAAGSFVPGFGNILGAVVGLGVATITDICMSFFAKTEEELIDTVWSAISVPTEKELEDEEVADRYQTDRSKGYVFLQDIFSDEQIAVLKKYSKVAGCLLLDYVRDDYKKTGNDVLGTLVYNISRILANHNPSIDLAWIRSYDDYYQNETGFVVMDTCATVSSVEAPNTGEENEASIFVSGSDPRLTLRVPNDTDNGAGIFYQKLGDHVSDTDWHPYCGPISLFSEAGAAFTLHTYAIHDGIRSATHEIGITVAEDQRVLCIYPDGNGGTLTQVISYETDEPFTLEAPAVETMTFKNWEVVTGDMTKLVGLDLNARSNTLCISDNARYILRANYFEKSNAVKLTLDEVEGSQTLPKTATLTAVKALGAEVYTDKQVTVPVTWTMGENNEIAIATVSLPVDEAKELVYIGQPQNDALVPFDSALNVQIDARVSNRNGIGIQIHPIYYDLNGIVHADGSAVVQVGCYIDGYQPAQIHKINIHAIDSNTSAATNFSVGSSTITYCCAAYEEAALPIPAVTAEQFMEVMDAAGIAIEDISIEDGILFFTMPDGDIDLTLSYKPVIHNLAIVFSTAPAGGEKLPEYVSCVATIENNWAVTDGIRATWSPTGTSSKTTAYYNTDYTATLTIDRENMQGGMIVDQQVPQTVALSGSFILASDVVYKVITEDGTVIPAVCTAEKEGDLVTKLMITFPTTAATPVTEVMMPTVAPMPYGSTEEEIIQALPAKVTAKLADNTVDEVDVIDWTLEAYTASLNGYNIMATGTLSSDIYTLDTVTTVAASIWVQPTPQAMQPTANLIVNGIAMDADSGDTVTVRVQDKHSVKLVLSAAENAKITYTLHGGEAAVYTEPIEIDWDDDANPMTVTLTAYAAEDGKQDSDVVYFTYTLTPVHEHRYTGVAYWNWTLTNGGYYAEAICRCADCDEGEQILPATVSASPVPEGYVTYTACVTIGETEFSTTKVDQAVYSLNITNGSIIGGLKKDGQYRYNDLITVQAAEPEQGKFFSGWYLNGKKVSDSVAYKFYLKSNTVIVAHYEAVPVQLMPLVSLEITDRIDLAGGGQQLKLIVRWELSRGYQPVEAGFVRTYDPTRSESLALENVDGSNIRSNTVAAVRTTGSYTLNLNLSAGTALKDLYAVGYLKCLNAAGETVTVYTDLAQSAAK